MEAGGCLKENNVILRLFKYLGSHSSLTEFKALLCHWLAILSLEIYVNSLSLVLLLLKVFCMYLVEIMSGKKDYLAS